MTTDRAFGCPVEVTTEAIGGKWKATILWWLRRSAKRPSELRQLIPRISQKVLTAQLQELEADGLVQRQGYRETPPRVDYSLTPEGETLRSLVELMAEWGKQKMPEFQFGIVDLSGIRLLIVGGEAETQPLRAQFELIYHALVTTAASTISLEQLRAQQPEVVLVNFEVDGADCATLVQQIRQLQSELDAPIPIIALAEAGDRGQAFAQGFRIVLVKPVEAVELVAAIAGFTGRLG